MNVIDSSGWLEYFTDGENATFFAPAIENPDNVIVPTIRLFEVFKRILATARDCSATLWTQDAQLKDLTDAKYIAKSY